MLTNQLAEDTGLPVAGRRKLRVVYNSYKTNSRRGGVYSFADIQTAKLHEDNLEGFLRAWESTILGHAEPQPVQNLQDLLYVRLKTSKRMALYIQLYERDEPDGPCFNYDYLLAQLRRVVEHDREAKRRARQFDGIKKVGGGGGAGGGAADAKRKPNKNPRPKPSLKAARPHLLLKNLLKRS